MKLSDFDIHAFGNTSLIAGVVYSGKPNVICWLPDKYEDSEVFQHLYMDESEWKTFLDQADQVHTEVMVGTEKAIMRKCLRVIDQNISWKVYERDSYICRYCVRTGLPLTVDHIDLWENGGATVEENLISSCKRCNKIRGNMAYGDWLNSPEYASVNGSLTQDQKQKNLEVLTSIPHLETLRVKTIKSR